MVTYHRLQIISSAVLVGSDRATEREEDLVQGEAAAPCYPRDVTIEMPGSWTVSVGVCHVQIDHTSPTPAPPH